MADDSRPTSPCPESVDIFCSVESAGARTRRIFLHGVLLGPPFQLPTVQDRVVEDLPLLGGGTAPHPARTLIRFPCLLETTIRSSRTMSYLLSSAYLRSCSCQNDNGRLFQGVSVISSTETEPVFCCRSTDIHCSTALLFQVYLLD